MKNFVVRSDCRGMDAQDIIDEILWNRDVLDPDDFLNPGEEYLLPLDSMIGIEEARSVVIDAINSKKKIKILGDVDLDGISSCTIMYRYLSKFTDNIDWAINKGKQHGLIGQDLSRFDDTEVIIIVDSLDKNTSQYEKLHEAGKEIVILDHHDVNPDVPYREYCSLVTSNVGYDNPSLSGAGVCWKFCKYLDEHFDTDYADEFVDLCTAGLIGDMMDLSVMENRYIVNQGLNNLRNPAMKKIVGSFPFNSQAVSFSIAPLVNASVRMNVAESAVKAFLADDNKDVLKYVKIMKDSKTKQGEIVDSVIDYVYEQCDKQLDNKVLVSFVESDGEIRGLIGNKILEKYGKPLFVLGKYDGKVSGSARATGIKDFRKMCEDVGMCEANGHPLAFGFECEEDNLDNVVSKLSEELKDVEFVNEYDIDAEIEVSDVTEDLINRVKEIDRISGTGFKPVTFLIKGVSGYEVGDMSKGKHIKLTVDRNLLFIKWNFSGDFEEYEEAALLDDEVEVVGTLTSGWLGRTFYRQFICDSIEII